MSVPPARRSSCVTLTLVSAAAAGSLALFGYGCFRQDGIAEPEPEIVSSGQTYSNNHYVPGAGYFHAPFGMWFPYRYNEYRPGSGYYYGGGWHPQPDRSPVTSSMPPAHQVSKVNSDWRRANPAAVQQARSELNRSGGTNRSGYNWSTKSSSSSSSSRGGFGRSGGGFSGS